MRNAPTLYVLSPLALVVGLGMGCSASDGRATDDGSHGASVEQPAERDDCELLVRFNQRCAAEGAPSSEACADARRQQCEAERATESSAYRDAIRACVDESTSCATGGAACIVEKLAVAPLTVAQEQLRDEYCDRCGTAGTSCARDFYVMRAPGGATDAGPGFILLTASDDVTSEVKHACVRSLIPTQCGVFSGCVSMHIRAVVPSAPAACR